MRSDLTAKQLDQMMVKVYGPDYREKVLATPMGTFRLADVFDECGLRDPQAKPPDTGGYGLWQITPARMPGQRAVDPFAQARAARASWQAWRSE